MIKTVDYHTLTIEILAKTAQLIEYDYNELFNALNFNLETEIRDVNHSKDKITKITEYLISIFKISNINKDELLILKQFTCLPAEFIETKLLKELTIEDKSYKKLPLVLNKLSQKGWLLKNTKTDSYKMHLIIGEVMKNQIPFEIKDVEYMIDVVSEKTKFINTTDDPINKFHWMTYAHTLLDTLEIKLTFNDKYSMVELNLR